MRSTLSCILQLSSLVAGKISTLVRCHVMNVLASSQWEMVYWLVLCCNKIGACVPLYEWACFQKTSGQLDCIFVQGVMFHTGGEKFFMQSEFIL